MAFSINQAFLVGNITNDPELKYTPSGTAVCNFNLATNRSKKNKQTDQWEDIPTFHRIVVWQKLAEIVAGNLLKGMKVTIVGRIDNRSYDAKDGTKKYISEIVADSVISAAPFKKKAAATPVTVAPATAEPSKAEDVSEDIPF